MRLKWHGDQAEDREGDAEQFMKFRFAHALGLYVS